MSEVSCLTQPQSSAHSAVLYMRDNKPQLYLYEWMHTNRLILSAVEQVSRTASVCYVTMDCALTNFSPDKHHCYLTRWFYTCNPTCTSGKRSKHNFLLFRRRGKVKESDWGTLAAQDDVFESGQCFVWRFDISFLTEDKLNFHKLNCKKKNSILNFSGALGTYCPWMKTNMIY